MAARAPSLGGPARELGFERWTTSWEELLDDPRSTSSRTCSRSRPRGALIAALERGKPVLCEKPLGVDAAQAWTMRDAAVAAGVANAVGFNYRYVPAVALAKQVLDEERLGEPGTTGRSISRTTRTPATRNARRAAPARCSTTRTSSTCSAFVGEPRTVAASTSSLLTDVDDAYVALFEFAQGLVAALEASRVATAGRGTTGSSHRSRGSAWWDMEDTNRLHVFLAADEEAGSAVPRRPRHAARPSVSRQWWPPGHVLGWEHSFVHQWRDFSRRCSRSEQSRQGRRAFEDGYRAAVLCEAIHASARREARRRRRDRAAI